MRTRSKLALVALAAALMLSVAVTEASARNLRVDEQNYRITWASLEFVEAGIFNIRVRCPVTMEGSFHSATIAKVIGSLVGYITRAAVKNESCTGGNATVLTATLPWHVTYEGFGGTLPSITSLRVLLVRPAFRLRVSFIECLSQPENILGTITGTREPGGAFKPERLAPDPGQVFPCGELRGEFVGSGSLTRLNATTRVLVTLI